MRLEDIAVAASGTHHEFADKPLYVARFVRVLKFHQPGLAAVMDTSGAYHIKPDGQPAYVARFTQAFGFYEGLAAVCDGSGWFHIRASGDVLYPERYSWCGNLQGGRVAVRNAAGLYFHLDHEGKRTYGEHYRYAGDYRDGVACVRRMDGLCIHIDRQGGQIHPTAFLDLDVFHKGFARARDERGWFHLCEDGSPAYAARFAEVEPFYNGQAYCRDWSGRRVVVDERGQIAQMVWEPPNLTGSATNCGQGPFILVVGNCGAGKTTLARSLGGHLQVPVLSIDSFRRTASDGSPAGEVRAWQQFLEALTMSSANGAVVEFSGSGYMAHLVKLALQGSGNYSVLWLRVSPEICMERVSKLTAEVPYPQFGVPVRLLIPELHARLEREMTHAEIWPANRVQILDGSVSPADLLTTALNCVKRTL